MNKPKFKLKVKRPVQRPAAGKNINISLSEAVTTEAGKWYKVLSAGEIHSQKYSGVWDANLDVYMNEEKPGLIVVKDNFLDAILANFRSNANETILFVDEDHNKGISFGPIRDMKIDIYQKTGKRSLFIQPEWNDLGVDAVENKHYMYLSIGISGHLNSVTGEYTFPVANTTSLTNLPVDKDQDVVEMNDVELNDGAPTGNNAGDKNKKKGVISMDEILNAINALKELIKGAIEGENGPVAKAMIGEAIDQMEIEFGFATEEEEKAEEKKPEEKPADEKKPEAPKDGADDGKTAEKTDEQIPAKGETKMSEKEIKLSERVSVLEIALAEQKKKTELTNFNADFLNKKFVKADAPKWEKLFLADKETTVSILKTMKDVGVLKTFGSDSDIDLKDIGTDPAKHKEAFDKAVVELSEKEKISLDAAINKIKASDPVLYAAGMKAHQPKEII